MNFNSFCYFLLFSLLCTSSTYAQKKQYKVGCIGFYNFENLFDTLDDPDIRDEEFTPDGSKRWTKSLYQEKLDHMADVVSQIGTDLTPDGLAILGTAETENRKVLEDFAKHPKLRARNYQVVHYDSPDSRGIDVALLYQPKYFTPSHTEALRLKIPLDNGDSLTTRDVLLVSGLFDGDSLHVLVNHWPSRRGGELRSRPNRIRAAMLNLEAVRKIQERDPDARIVIMGDLNDDPTSPSVKQILKAKSKRKKVASDELYNPMYDFYKKGVGTTAWRDAWSLFDQIIISGTLLQPTDNGYRYYKAEVFNKSFMTQKIGQFKGYPLRTFVGDSYRGGYSDHFPVYMYMVREL
ncbi:MAG: endonuclease/exonuclease/phosphatase family protein [Bacteroidota bacterium]